MFGCETIYRCDYTPKSVGRPVLVSSQSKVGHSIINASFPKPFEWRDSDFEQKIDCSVFKAYEQGVLGNWCPPLNCKLLRKYFFEQNGSTYMANYCTADDNAKRGDVNRKSLPSGWIIQPTTQRASYRDPQDWIQEPMKRNKTVPLADNLTPNCDGLQYIQANACQTRRLQGAQEVLHTDKVPTGVIVDAQKLGSGSKMGEQFYPLKPIPLGNLAERSGLFPICPLLTSYQNDYIYRGDPRTLKPYEFETEKEKCRVFIKTPPSYFYGRVKTDIRDKIENDSDWSKPDPSFKSQKSAKSLFIDKDSEYMSSISRIGGEIMTYKILARK